MAIVVFVIRAVVVVMTIVEIVVTVAFVRRVLESQCATIDGIS